MFLLGYRIQVYYEYLAVREVNNYETSYGMIEDLWWIPLLVWHVVLSIAASLLVHRYLANGRTSTFVRWQAIGAGALIGWGLTVFAAISVECLRRGDTWPINEATMIARLIPVAQFFAAVFASNVLYGTAIQAASTSTEDPANLTSY
jgi:hypothetical protein